MRRILAVAWMPHPYLTTGRMHPTSQPHGPDVAPQDQEDAVASGQQLSRVLISTLAGCRLGKPCTVRFMASNS